jgi:hypothetical protein
MACRWLPRWLYMHSACSYLAQPAVTSAVTDGRPTLQHCACASSCRVSHAALPTTLPLQAEGLAPVGSPQLLQYHPPFAPGWMRHNEVLYVIKDV